MAPRAGPFKLHTVDEVLEAAFGSQSTAAHMLSDAKTTFSRIDYENLTEKEQHELLNWVNALWTFARAVPGAGLPALPEKFLATHNEWRAALKAVSDDIDKLRAWAERSLAKPAPRSGITGRVATRYGTTPERWAAENAWR